MCSSAVAARDVLLDHERQQFDIYTDRVNTAEARGAWELTVVFAIATLTVTGAQVAGAGCL